MNNDNIKMSIVSSLVLSIMDESTLGAAWDTMTHEDKKNFLVKMNKHIRDTLELADKKRGG